MSTMSIRYFVTKKNEDGTFRYYWQPDIHLRKHGWKFHALPSDRALAIQEAEEINARVDQWRLDKTAPKNERPGSVSALVQKYKRARDFNTKAPRTQKDYSHYLDTLIEWAGDEPAVMINSRMAADLYESARKTSERKAMYLMQVGRILFGFAERQSLIPKGTNPFTRQRLSYKSKKGALWTRDAIRIYAETADAMDETALATALILNEWLGQRPGDLIRLHTDMINGGVIEFAQSKTGAEISLPFGMVPHLCDRLTHQIRRSRKLAPKSKFIFIGKSGTPFTDNGFHEAFKRVKAKVIATHPDKPELAGLVFQTTRHTAITRLTESGCTELEIAAVSGHKIQGKSAIIDRYNVRTKKQAEQAFQKRIDAEKQ